MGSRQEALRPGEIYHIYNRGVARANIFNDDKDRQRFLHLLLYHLPDRQQPSFSIFRRIHKKESLMTIRQQRPNRGEGLVDLIAYCLMDNHIHLLLHENTQKGIATYLQRVLTSYAKYFNTRHQRQGPLFSGRFKAAHVSNDEQFLHVTRYIHINPFAAGMVKDPHRYKWSSINETPDLRHACCHTEHLFEQISPSDYRNFVTDYAAYLQELEEIREVAIDL